MGTFSAPIPASLPQRLLLPLLGAALLGPTPLPCRQPIACSRRMPAQSQAPPVRLLALPVSKSTRKACQAKMLTSSVRPPALLAAARTYPCPCLNVSPWFLAAACLHSIQQSLSGCLTCLQPPVSGAVPGLMPAAKLRHLSCWTCQLQLCESGACPCFARRHMPAYLPSQHLKASARLDLTHVDVGGACEEVYVQFSSNMQACSGELVAISI